MLSLIGKRYAFHSHVNDPDVVQAFEDKYRTFKREVNAEEILSRLAQTNGWHQDDIEVLASVEVEE
jgi:hypothetical protein